ncbi:FtsX-like permease family protein, partial [candidate division KSB1 bacterium]
DAMGSFNTLGKFGGRAQVESFDFWNNWTYVLLPETHDKAVAAQKMTDYFNPMFREQAGGDIAFDLYDMQDVYFNFNSGGGDIQVVYMFMAISIFILILACINFINLTTARAVVRAKEIGIRKVVGSSKSRIIFQFLGESTLYSILSFLLAVIIVKLIIMEFNGLTGLALSFSIFSQSFVQIFTVSAVIAIGLLAGIYPAFYISSFSAGAVLKGEVTRGKSSAAFRKALIVFQYAISITLIIGTITVFEQLEYMKSINLGFAKDQIVNFNYSSARGVRNRQDAFKQALLQSPDIQGITFSQGYPGFIFNNESFMHEGERTGFVVYTVDTDYFDVFDLEIVDGRPFSKEIASDEFRTCLMNEAAVRVFGLENPVGHVFHKDETGGSSFPVNDIEVIGVVKDFHFQSLHQEVRPLVFSYNRPWFWNANVKISGQNVSETIAFIEEAWNEFSPDFPFEYTFLDESFDKQYRNDEMFGKFFGYFSFIAIFIACLGLFGMASYMTARRTKEIGIRKTLGASSQGITVMLSREFSKWVIIANVIAWPAAWYLMNYWLQNFAYQMSMSPIIFIAAGTIAYVIALLTVGYQTLKGARTNPVDSLRYE